MRLSGEWKLGLVVTLVVALSDVSHAIWRVLLLGGLLLVTLDICWRTDWVMGKSETLTLEGIENQEEPSRVRLGFTVLAVTAAVLGFGIVTWPPSPMSGFAGSRVAIGLEGSPQSQIYLPSSNGVLPNRGDASAGLSGSGGASGTPAAPVETAKPGPPTAPRDLTVTVR